MDYKVWISNPADHFAGIKGIIHNTGGKDFALQLPAWRPGRYELGNFAKNIRNFKVTNKQGNAVAFQKTSKDRWHVSAKGETELVVEYEYYSNQPDAGACYVHDALIYLNPVHCFMYVEGQMHNEYRVTLDVPANWIIACQLRKEGHTLIASSFDQLADSPFFASPNLIQHTFAFEQKKVHFWFEGGSHPDLVRLERDTRKYALEQCSIFGGFPPAEYHFLYLMLPDKFRHGVEHEDSTVIAMGPVSADNPWEEDFYHDFLAISSHELFHLWNVKRMRPAEMFHYDFTKENYSELGYIYEGITTYYGDLMLLRSGVWDFERYAKSLAADFDRHYNNPGRNNYSVAESSFDTWLDGYVPGVKGRKVSIYMEGLIAALVADVMILEATDGKKRLDDVLAELYKVSFGSGRGYTEAQYHEILERISGKSFASFFADLIHGCGKWDAYIDRALSLLGLGLIKQENVDGQVVCRIVKLPVEKIGGTHLFDNWTKTSYFGKEFTPN